MKNKALKHYNRKKFFYRFFMRKSPRQGTMFGLALMNMNIALSPFLVLMMVRGAAIALDDSWVGTFVFIGPKKRVFCIYRSLRWPMLAI